MSNRLSRRASRISRLIATGALLLAANTGHAALIGQWTFEGSGNAALVDSTGNFGDLQLHGDASIANGKLTVSGSGTTVSGWAGTSGYTGATITDKTLAVWVTLNALSATANAGSAMTLDRIGGDQFDGVIYGEMNTNTWLNGSSNWNRTQAFSAGVTESASTLNQLIEMVYTYHDLGGGQVQITGYRNGVSMGSYTSGNAVSWNVNDAEILFGIRHTPSPGSGPGALDATISEARIYNTALSATEVQALSLTSSTVPEPASFALLGLGLAGLGLGIRRKA